MVQAKTATLTAIFSDVLANLAFMFSDESPAEACPEESWLETVISYRGQAACGTLTLTCPVIFCRMLAANLLGVDEEDEEVDAKSQDAVQEFMNIVCGQLITALHGAEPIFDLSIPVSRELPEPPDLAPDDDPAVSDLTVEGYPVRLTYAPDAPVVGG